MEYKLFIKWNEEGYSECFRSSKGETETPFFGISNSFINGSGFPKVVEVVNLVDKISEYSSSRLPYDIEHTYDGLIMYEKALMQYAMNLWLLPYISTKINPGTIPTPMQKYVNPFKSANSIDLDRYWDSIFEPPAIPRRSDYAYDMLKNRCSECNSYIQPVTNKDINIGAKVFTSDTFLSLAWAEIMFAIEHNIHSKECPVCKNWFPVLNKKYESPLKQKLCGSPECKKTFEKERRNSPEFKEYTNLGVQLLRETRPSEKKKIEKRRDEIREKLGIKKHKK
ncbi:MAG TPA: hypothetical protein VF941_00745 [Clostridia bacterium]